MYILKRSILEYYSLLYASSASTLPENTSVSHGQSLIHSCSTASQHYQSLSRTFQYPSSLFMMHLCHSAHDVISQAFTLFFIVQCRKAGSVLGKRLPYNCQWEVYRRLAGLTNKQAMVSHLISYALQSLTKSCMYMASMIWIKPNTYNIISEFNIL